MSTKRKLITNFISLASMQMLNFILPLITLPYLLHVVGPNKFGLISFAQAFIQYFILFTDYGFNLTATKDVSLARDNKEKLSLIFSTVILVKILLLVFSLLALMLLVFNIPKFRNDWLLYLLTFGMVVGNVLFPVWFFQGIEQMKIISILNIVAKTTFTVGIFVFVKSETEFLYIPLFNALGYISVGVVAIYIIVFRNKIHFILPTRNDIVYQLKEGWHIFLTSIITSLYTTSNTFILGFFVSNTVVGYYSSAEKVIKAVTMIISPIIQTVYPFFSKALRDSREISMWLLNKLFIVITIGMGILSSLIFFSANLLVNLFLGANYEVIIPILKILAILPLILGWANIFAILIMINLNYKKELSRIYILTGLLSIILMSFLIPVLKEYGTALNVIFTEIFATLLMVFFLWKKHLTVWKWGKRN